MSPLYNSEFRNKGWQRKLELWNYKRKGCLGTNCRSDCAECSAWPQGCCVWGKQPLPVAIVRGLPSYACSKVHKLKRQRVFGRKLCPAGRSLNGRLFSQWEARGLTGSHPNVSIKDRFDVHFPSKYKYKDKDTDKDKYKVLRFSAWPKLVAREICRFLKWMKIMNMTNRRMKMIILYVFSMLASDRWF